MAVGPLSGMPASGPPALGACRHSCAGLTNPARWGGRAPRARPEPPLGMYRGADGAGCPHFSSLLPARHTNC